MKDNQQLKEKYHWPPLNLPRLPTREEMDQFIACIGGYEAVVDVPSRFLVNYAAAFDVDEFGHKIIVLLTDNDRQGFPEGTIIVEAYNDEYRLLGAGKNVREEQEKKVNR